jgi:elongation factor P hydroxylase
MTNQDYHDFKKAIIIAIAGIIISAIATSVAFYFSTTNAQINHDQLLQRLESEMPARLERREFERYMYECERRDAARDKKFEQIDQKLDWLIKNR